MMQWSIDSKMIDPRRADSIACGCAAALQCSNAIARKCSASLHILKLCSAYCIIVIQQSSDYSYSDSRVLDVIDAYTGH